VLSGLPRKGKNRLMEPIASGFGAAAGRIALDDEEFVLRVVFRLSRGELIADHQVILLGFGIATGGFFGFSRGIAGFFGSIAFMDQIDRERLMLIKIIGKAIRNDAADDRSGFGAAEFAFGLAFVFEFDLPGSSPK
jgi:hypothetical protein